jgi:hypothetical protein
MGSIQAYLRGQTISYVSHAKKLEAIKLSVISEEILQLDNQYAVAPTLALYNRHLHLQAEFDVLSTSKDELLLVKSRQCIFETGDKAIKLFAYQARSAAASRLITKIKLPTGDIELCKCTDCLLKRTFYTHNTISRSPVDAILFLRLDK